MFGYLANLVLAPYLIPLTATIHITFLRKGINNVWPIFSSKLKFVRDPLRDQITGWNFTKVVFTLICSVSLHVVLVCFYEFNF